MMKKLAILILLFLTLPAFADIVGFCVAVSDGDTIKVLCGGKETKIRLAGIDCPESSQDFGQAAKRFTSQLCFNKIVEVKGNEFDKYGRLIGVVSVEGKEVNLELLKTGLAWHYVRYSSRADYAEAEQSARLKKIGLWSQNNPVNPEEYRRVKKWK